MNEEPKIVNTELKLEDLEQVAGGSGLVRSGAVTYKLPANCPYCGAALVRPRNAKKTDCLNCGAEVEAVKSGSTNPDYSG